MRKEGVNEKRSSVGGQRLACPLPWPILAKENVSYGSPSLKRGGSNCTLSSQLLDTRGAKFAVTSHDVLSGFLPPISLNTSPQPGHLIC
jgi:hypothetical protein